MTTNSHSLVLATTVAACAALLQCPSDLFLYPSGRYDADVRPVRVNGSDGSQDWLEGCCPADR